MTFEHFNGDSGASTVRLSSAAVADCSHHGACDADVAHWLGRVEWLASADELRRILRGCGAWDDLETASDVTLRERMLWLAACDCRDAPDIFHTEGGAA